MTEQAILTASLSSPSVSRWLGFFPEFRQDSLGFLLRCHSYGDVVKLPMGRMAELLFRQQDFAMYLLNNPADVKHVLVTNQHITRKIQSLLSKPVFLEKACCIRRARPITTNDGCFSHFSTETMWPPTQV